jgi:hypothetical protein
MRGFREEPQVHRQPEFVQTLVLRAVRRYIADRIRSGSIVSASACATEILAAYPALELDHRAVADEVMLAAGRAGVAVEIGRPLDPAHAA